MQPPPPLILLPVPVCVAAPAPAPVHGVVPAAADVLGTLTAIGARRQGAVCIRRNAKTKATVNSDATDLSVAHKIQGAQGACWPELVGASHLPQGGSMCGAVHSLKPCVSAQ